MTIRAEALTKTFHDGEADVPVLRGISLALERGEVVALEGPSGSGKTTLLSILGCILTPTSGRLEIDGVAAAGLDARALAALRKQSIGFVFQQFNLFPSLTAVENVEYALEVRGRRGTEARQEAERAIEAVGLGDRARFFPRDLSGGQKQRVAIARAIAGRPPVLLADEPTANLDSENGGKVLDLLRALARRDESALLIVTHDKAVRHIADRVLSIRDGLLER
ncbi:MAG TPA: ABC transporter ATP-binding protein [Thermoanaerobaculia bacterium]